MWKHCPVIMMWIHRNRDQTQKKGPMLVAQFLSVRQVLPEVLSTSTWCLIFKRIIVADYMMSLSKYMDRFSMCNNITLTAYPVFVSWQARVIKIVAVMYPMFGELWWHHETETFSTILAVCGGNPHVTDGFPLQMASDAGFYISFDVSLNKQLNKPGGEKSILTIVIH